MNEAPAIHARGLVKRYEQGRVTALVDVDLDVDRGEWVAICGPSGCGKTTLLNMISAIDTPDAGELTVCGHTLCPDQAGQPGPGVGCDPRPDPVVNRRPRGATRPPNADAFRREAIGMVFQLHNLLPRLTALENVQVPLLAARVAPAERVQRATTLLRRVGLESRMHARPPALSGGERQRVAICRGLVNRPAVLLADEPTGALDSHNGDQLFDLLSELRAEQGLTLVVVTHDPLVAARAQRVLRMLDGRILTESAPSVLMHTGQQPIRASSPG